MTDFLQFNRGPQEHTANLLTDGNVLFVNVATSIGAGIISGGNSNVASRAPLAISSTSGSQADWTPYCACRDGGLFGGPGQRPGPHIGQNNNLTAIQPLFVDFFMVRHDSVGQRLKPLRGTGGMGDTEIRLEDFYSSLQRTPVVRRLH